MVVRRLPNTDSELYHHGIIDQKWGVRHGPPYPLGSGSSTGSKVKTGAKPKSVVTSKIANSKSTMYRNKKAGKNVTVSNKTISKKVENTDSKKPVTKYKEVTKKIVTKSVPNSTTNKNKTGEKFQISDKTKKILIGAGIAAGAIVVGAVAYRTYNIYSKTHFDTALDKVKFNRYQKGSEFNINDGLSAYMTKNGLVDKLHYKQLVGGKNEYDTMISATAHNVNVPSFEKSRDIFMKTYNSDPSIQRDLSFAFESGLANYSSRAKKSIPDKRRIKLYQQALDIMDNGKTDPKSQAILYDAWNTMITNNTASGGWTSTNKLFDAYKQQGYSAIWDNHDIYISGFKANNPMIVFDKSQFTDVSARQMSKAEIEIGRKYIGPAFTSLSNPIDKLSSYLYNPDILSIRF